MCVKSLKELGKIKNRTATHVSKTGVERKGRLKRARSYKASDFMQGSSTNRWHRNIKHSRNSGYPCVIIISIIPELSRDFRKTSDLTKPTFQSSGSRKA